MFYYARPARPVKELLDLERLRPQEPFRDRLRRPNGYRYMPEHIDWEQATNEHEELLTAWYPANLLLSSPGPGQVEPKLAGRRVPGRPFRREAEGYACIDPNYAKLVYPQTRTMLRSPAAGSTT